MLPLPRYLSALATSLALAACTTAGPSSVPRDPAPEPPSVTQRGDTCGARSVQDRVGRDFDEMLRSAIEEESGAAVVRVLRPGDAATMDHRPDRLNIRLDDDDRIEQITCG
ncbi:hypothetical protein IEI94_06705 [Halomonas sp. ML-15]|uniref:I78 family peptidase inhibitor n=1 Tax=Halomonas sp. ML-15 TaxID=2773305 RepID=UPI0017465544|nr:I78 family peptidase inhibitor [Halomonas sp. ML-15]MBD3895538.1 hypothetical protein [Halomonas sp. ML-15]